MSRTREHRTSRRLVTPRAGIDLTPRERVSLGAEILGAYVRASWRLRRSGLDPALEAMRESASPQQPLSRGIATRLGSTVVKVLRLLPTDSRCLMRSLVLTRLLTRRGTESRLVIAVRPAPDFAAHAWIEVSGEPVLEPSRPPFERLLER